MARRAICILLLLAPLAGCESTHQTLIAQGYPPAYADGFDDGCGSGRQAASAITGEFRKDVPRYLADAQYALGWCDGFQQCQAQYASQEHQRYDEQRSSDRDWEQQKDQAFRHVLHDN